jgi:hypothetical protein
MRIESKVSRLVFVTYKLFTVLFYGRITSTIAHVTCDTACLSPKLICIVSFSGHLLRHTAAGSKVPLITLSWLARFWHGHHA